MRAETRSNLYITLVILAAAVLAATAFYLLESGRMQAELEDDLSRWAGIVRSELMSPAPDPAGLSSAVQDPLSGEPSVGILVLDRSNRIMFSNREEFFPSGETFDMPGNDAATAPRLRMDDTEIVLYPGTLPAAAAVGSSFVVYSETPAPSPGDSWPTLAAVALALAVSGIGLHHVLTSPLEGERPRSSAADGYGDDRPGITLPAELMGSLSLEILELAKSLREREARGGGESKPGEWREIGERATRLLGTASDMALLADLSSRPEVPVEAFSVGELLEDAVADMWDELRESGTRVRLPSTDLLLEGDAPTFSRAVKGLIKFEATRCDDIAIEVGLYRGRVHILVTCSGSPRGGENGGLPPVRAHLVREIAATVARVHGGELIDAPPDRGGTILVIPQWRHGG